MLDTPNTAPNTNEQTSSAADNGLIFYGTKDVAAALGCSIPTAREIMRRADFPLILAGKNMKVSKSAFEKWAMERRT